MKAKTKQVTHEYELIAETFEEACDLLKECHAAHRSGFSFASISKEVDYTKTGTLGWDTGRFDVKLKWWEKLP